MSNRSTTVFIHELRLHAIVGIHSDERVAAQPVVLDIELDIEFGRDAHAGDASHTITDTIDYSSVAERVTELVVAGNFHLLETMAHQVADMLLSTYPAAAVQVQVAKPRALEAADAAGVKIRRSA